MPPDDESVPLFPLKTVLFPGGVLPLRIFEPRYLDMVRQCLKTPGQFGVLLILEGSETGAAHTAAVGTLAEIVDWHQEADGVLGVVAVGRQRFTLNHASRREDGLYVGRIRRLADEPKGAVPARYEHLARLLRQVLPRLGAYHRHLSEDYCDASWVGYRLAEFLPLSLDERQACLEMEDPVARLEKLGASVN